MFVTVKFYFNLLKKIFIIHWNIGCKDAYINLKIYGI